MRSFSEVAFDFKGGRIKLDGEWEPVQASVSGSNPMARSKAVTDEVCEIQGGHDTMNLMDPELTLEESELLKQLTREFPTLFAINPKRPSHIIGSTEHSVELTSITPRRTRPRRIPPSWEEEVSRQVDEMCKNGICRPSKSDWSSDVVLVCKKDGQMRFAIDYRQLNSVTKKDAYGPPNPQTILDKLEGSQYFSCLDVTSAYWCVPMKESDIPKTAFHTPRGLY